MEQWKTCIYNGEVFPNYEVSTEGRVRSLNYRKTGEIKILKPSEARKKYGGYLVVTMYKNGKPKTVFIHRIVACTFIPNPNGLKEINHINENKHDNRVENLEWCDRDYNIHHGTRGKRQGEKQSRKVKATNIKTGEVIVFNSIKQASEETGCDMSLIVKVCKGKRKTCGGFHWEYDEE